MEFEGQLEQQRLRMEQQAEMLRLQVEQQAKEKELMLEAKLEQLRLPMEAQRDEQDRAMRRWEAVLDAQTKVEVSQIGADARAAMQVEPPDGDDGED